MQNAMLGYMILAVETFIFQCCLPAYSSHWFGRPYPNYLSARPNLATCRIVEGFPFYRNDFISLQLKQWLG